MDAECIVDADAYFDVVMLQHIKAGRDRELLSSFEGVHPSRLTNRSGSSLLHFAAKYGNVSLVRHLIGLGANIDAINSLNETPLMLAVQNNHLEAVNALLEANADILIPSLGGHCPLGQAIINANSSFETVSRQIKEVIRAQVTRDSLKNNRYVESETFLNDCPLYEFMPLKNIGITRDLLENGSAVDARDKKTGKTSLHIAIEELDVGNVRLLLEYNANVKRSLDFLKNLGEQNNALAIFNMLMAAGATMIDYEYHYILVDSLLKRGNREVIRSILKNQLDLQFVDNDGFTPLRYLARNPNHGVLDELSDYDFDVNCDAYPSNWTMLHLASRCGNPSSIQFLADRGANVDATDRDGYTPLSLILRKQDEKNRLDSYVECIEILLANGADPTKVKVMTRYASGPPIEMIKPIIIHLSAIDESGKFIDWGAQTFLGEHSVLRQIFKSKKDELKAIKEQKLSKTVTLLDFLVANNEKVSVYARYRRLASHSFEDIEKYELHPSYQRKVNQNIRKFMKLIELRNKVAMAMDQLFGKLCNVSVYRVAEKIVEYLEDHELPKFFSAMT